MFEWLNQSSPMALFGLLVLAIILLYFARLPVHRVLMSFAQSIHRSLKLASRSINQAESRLAKRNHEVLLASGREHVERMIEREFERVDESIQKELSKYPELHRQLNESISRIEQDYTDSVEVPPEPTGWSKAAEALAKVQTKGDPVIGHVMEEMSKSMKKAELKAIDAYRESNRNRHLVLKSMMPKWRSIQKHLGLVDKTIQSLLQRGAALDRHIEDFEHIRKGTDRALRMLSSSSMSQFFISLFVLFIAVGGAVINFNLIARPMAEMVGGTNMVGGFKTADIAALVIILVEISMGLFLMECLRITRLFPVIHTLHDRLRIRMMWIAFSILLILASVEAGLAFMREILMQEDLAISAHLRGSDISEEITGVYWITTASQMGMGFILPFALTFVAIPLENFIASLRTVMGLTAGFLLRFLAMLLRVVGTLSFQLGRILVNLFDLLIFIPLAIEHWFKRDRNSAKESENFIENIPSKNEKLTTDRSEKLIAGEIAR